MLLRWLVVVALQAAAKPGNANLPSGNHDDGNGEKQYAEHFFDGQADERPRRRGIVAPIPVLNGKGAGVGLRKRLLRVVIAVGIIIFKHYALPLDAADISGIPFLVPVLFKNPADMKDDDELRGGKEQAKKEQEEKAREEKGFGK